MTVLIPTCDRYIKYIEALQLSVKKYGLDDFEFIILGYKEPNFELNKNFMFVSLGEDRGAQFWSNDVSCWVKNSGLKHFIYGSDDCALTYLDRELLETAIKITQFNDLVGRFALTAEGIDRPKTSFFAFNWVSSPLQFSHSGHYLLSLGWSIWNAECFFEFCDANMSPWDFELQSVNPTKDVLKRLLKWRFLTYMLASPIDAAYFRRKNVKGVVKDWNKGYYGNDLQGEMKEKVEEIIFRE